MKNIEYNRFISEFDNWENLKPLQQQCIILMIQGVNIRDIARELEIAESTIYHWLGQECFKMCLAKWQKELLIEVKSKVRIVTLRAIDELDRIVTNPNLEVKDKLKAIEMLLKFIPEVNI